MLGLVASLVLAVVLTSAAPPAAERTVGDLRLQVTVGKDAFARGEPVSIFLRVVNSAASPVAVTFPSSQQFDLIVRQRGALIWQWSHDKAFLQVIREVPLAPGETRTFSGTWDQRDLQGRQVDPGTYDVYVAFLGWQRGGARGIEVGPVRITIQR
ncbi:MAG: BsuPI-related putative proteinase inhibitor [Armatimonadota bacterium]|nr:BsuPI-related putative proteinase inhibitor [Armatimonadota bacterium]MDR7534322.1 BsuPI-related putative proteinase inhibitor [Armatimonadota bacterium]MDR7537492.1 BsuPI-related putative proteinase inhibitor [Armatimonadota bacterium]